MILEDIVESTKERVETNKKRHSIYELKENYSVSINSLVNIAIRNAVTEEKMETKGLDKLK